MTDVDMRLWPSNNSLRHSMAVLRLPSATISKIIDDPTLLGSRLSTTTSSTLQGLGISSVAADHILDGYTTGFRIVFIVNAVLAAIATVVSVVMIHHKELTRADEEQLREKARREEKHSEVAQYRDDSPAGKVDIEMPELRAHPEARLPVAGRV